MTTARLTFSNMLDDAAMMSLEAQLWLEDRLGRHEFSVDLDEPRLQLTGEHPMVFTDIHLLGTAAPGPRSWRWSWAAAGQFLPRLTGLASALADFGRAYAIEELTSPEVPFAALPGPATRPHEAVALMIDAAKAFSGIWFAYNCDAGGGTRAAFLLQHADLVLPPPDPARVLRVIQQSITNLNLHDHRRALAGYAQRRPLGHAFSSDYRNLRITGPRLDVEISFDNLGRATDVNGALG